MTVRGGETWREALALPPRQPWSARLAEAPYIAGLNELRIVPFLVFVVIATPIFAIRVVDGPGRVSSAFALTGCLLGDFIIVKWIDGRLGQRDAALSRWATPEFVDQARRYHLRKIDDHDEWFETPKLRIAGSARELGDPRETIGLLRGNLHGQRIAIAEVVPRHGPLTWMVLGITWLRRPHPMISVEPRLGPQPGLGKPRGRRRERSEFERAFRLRGEGAPEVGLELQSWLVENATGMAFEVRDEVLVCRMHGEANLSADEIGRYLAALLGFATRLEGRTPPRAA